MLALILSDDALIHHRLSASLSKRGFQVVLSESRAMATAHVRAWAFDLVILAERVNGTLTHSVALSAEKRAPFVKTVLLTDRKDTDIDELYDLLPSLVSIVSPTVSPELIGKIALSSINGPNPVAPQKQCTPTLPTLVLPVIPAPAAGVFAG